jgi:hypothetical protein
LVRYRKASYFRRSLPHPLLQYVKTLVQYGKAFRVCGRCDGRKHLRAYECLNTQKKKRPTFKHLRAYECLNTFIRAYECLNTFIRP